jgi:hypothetical protein
MKHLVRGLIWGSLALVYIAFFAIAGYFAFGGFGSAFAVIVTNPWVFVGLTILHAILGDAYQSLSVAAITTFVLCMQFFLGFVTGVAYHYSEDTHAVKRSLL